METICYYFCCFGCFGLCCEPKYSKKDEQKEKTKTLKQLKAISPKSGVKTVASHPISMKTKEMTDYYEIPNDNFKTCDDVIKSYGFSRGQELGSGASGVVYKGKHITSDLAVAIKVCQLPEQVDRPTQRDLKARKKAIKIAKSELFVLQNIRHPHIIQLLYHFVIVQNEISSLYLVMQFGVHGDMSAFLRRKGPFNERTSKIWFAQILSALIYMHRKGCAHRDLKLSNILLDVSDDVLITDFGLSQVVPTQTLHQPFESTTYCGTPSYMAPEVLRKKADRRLMNVPYDPFLADVWSVGVVLYNLLNNCYPFHVTNDNSAKVIKRMKRKEWDFSPNMLSPPSLPLQQMMKQIFEPNPKRRPKMFELSRSDWVSAEYIIVEQKCKQWMQEIRRQINP